METWYKTNFSLRITPVKVERSTDKSIWLEDFAGKFSRAAKESTYENYFPSFQLAKEFLVTRETQRLEAAKEKLSAVEKSLSVALTLEEPK